MRREAATGPGEMLLWVALAALLAALLGEWLWTGLAGLLFGRGWPNLPPSELLGAALHLPEHLGDPAAAYPPGVRSGLPGAGAFLAVGLGLLAGAAGAALLLARAGGEHRRGRPAQARWARTRELSVLFARRRETGRLVLGRRGRRLLAAERRHALVAFGPPQSGKSAGLAVPALLEWPGCAVASSIKTDLLAATQRRRGELGDVLIFDPFGLAGGPSHTWSPLREAGTWDGALTVAARMASAGELDQGSVEGGDFWSIAAEQRLAPLLYTAARSGDSIAAVVRWVYGQGTWDLERRLERLLHEDAEGPARRDAQAAYDAVRAFEAQADRTRSSIEGTAQAMLRAYRFASVARSAAGCEITAERLLGGPNTLYLIGDAKASKLLRPIFLALLQEIVDHAFARATLSGGSLAIPLLLCLDEAGNVAPLPNLAEIASTAPSHNIQLLTIFHDLTQARARYRGQAETVVNSHRARMLLPGVADLETLRLFSGLVGEGEAPEMTRTSGSGGSTRSWGRRRLPLVAPEALRQLPERHALLLYGRLAPTRVRLRTWFDDRRLRRLGG